MKKSATQRKRVYNVLDTTFGVILQELKSWGKYSMMIKNILLHHLLLQEHLRLQVQKREISTEIYKMLSDF